MILFPREELTMPANPYDEILSRAKQLSPEEQNKLVDELSQLAGRKNGGTHSILDLEGLGKDVWKGVDAGKYVAEERDSWDG
jgi:hypothetical protein